MPMALYRFRFAARPDRAGFVAQLIDHAGRRLARAIDLEWTDDDRGGVLGVLSMNPVAIAYAAKVATSLGGERVPLVEGTPVRPLPSWVGTRWADLPFWTRVRLRTGVRLG